MRPPDVWPLRLARIANRHAADRRCASETILLARNGPAQPAVFLALLEELAAGATRRRL